MLGIFSESAVIFSGVFLLFSLHPKAHPFPLSLHLQGDGFVVLTSLAYLLQKEDEVTQIMLSKISGIDVMTVSQIINLLEKNGFIERKQHSKDTRANSVFLTSKGQNILEKAVPLVENIDDNFFNILGEKEQLFRELLKKL